MIDDWFPGTKRQKRAGSLNSGNKTLAAEGFLRRVGASSNLIDIQPLGKGGVGRHSALVVQQKYFHLTHVKCSLF